jgi:hypothetical protein
MTQAGLEVLEGFIAGRIEGADHAAARHGRQHADAVEEAEFLECAQTA